MHHLNIGKEKQKLYKSIMESMHLGKQKLYLTITVDNTICQQIIFIFIVIGTWVLWDECLILTSSSMECSVEYLSGGKGATKCSRLPVPLCNLTPARRHFPVFESMISRL